MRIIVYNCRTQHSTEQFGQSSLLSSRQSPLPRWCLLEGQGTIYQANTSLYAAQRAGVTETTWKQEYPSTTSPVVAQQRTATVGYFPGLGQCLEFPSVLWHCCLSDRKDIWLVNNLCQFPLTGGRRPPPGSPQERPLERKWWCWWKLLHQIFISRAECGHLPSISKSLWIQRWLPLLALPINCGLSPGQPGWAGTILDFTGARNQQRGWQRHQLNHMQIICSLLQTNNHVSTSPISFYRPDALMPPNQQCQSTERISCVISK